MPDTRPGDGFAIYARLSRKKVGRAKRRRNELETVERQIAIIRRWAAEEGVPISDCHIYIDNHLSAWKGERPRWEAMLAAAERREFPGILAYKLDRFARNTPDAYSLTRLGDEYGLVVDGPYGGRINLQTAQGRKQFRDAASAAEFDSDNNSERAHDALKERAAKGLQIGGGRFYGFEILGEVREDDDDTEPIQRPGEVQVIREVARRLIDGELLSHLAAELNERGVPTVRGGKWRGETLRAVIEAPRNGGYVMFKGRVVARNQAEPILDEDTYSKVQAILAARKQGRRPTGQFPLSGVLLCANPAHGDQPHPMAGHRHRSGQNERVRDYICARHNGGCGTTVVAALVEPLVREKVLEDANNPDLVAELSAEARALTEARMTAAAKVERLDGLLADLEEQKALETIRPHAYERAKAVLDRRIAEAESEARQLGASAGSGNLPALTSEQYDVLTPAEIKVLIGQLRLRVLLLPRPEGAPRNKFDPERVRVESLRRAQGDSRASDAR